MLDKYVQVSFTDPASVKPSTRLTCCLRSRASVPSATISSPPSSVLKNQQRRRICAAPMLNAESCFDGWDPTRSICVCMLRR